MSWFENIRFRFKNISFRSSCCNSASDCDSFIEYKKQKRANERTPLKHSVSASECIDSI